MKSAWIASCWLAAGTLAFGFQGGPSTSSSPAKGIIAGQVFNLATGQPLKKATVRLVGLGTRQQQNSNQGGGPPVAINKETDDTGHFSFSALNGGRYQLSVDRPGFLRQSYGSRRFNTSGTPIPLGPDQQIQDIVFKLAPQSVIAGKVLDEDGDPMANAQVRALRYEYRGGKKQWTQAGNGNTTDIGEYRIPNLIPGRYLVSAIPHNNGSNTMMGASNEPLPEKPETVYATTYYPNGMDSATAAPVDVGPGAEVRGIDIHPAKTRAFRIRGKVINTVTGGRGQITVMLSPKDNAAGSNPHVAVARPPENNFEFRGVQAGSYVLHAQTGGGPQQIIGTLPMEIGSNHVDGVVLTLAAGNDIGGTVKIADATAPVDTPNLNVYLRPVGLPIGGNWRSKVDADMAFSIKNVQPLTYAVSVSGVPDSCYVQSIRFGGQIVPDSGIEMSSPAPLDITLSATAAEVDGQIVDKDGKPVAGAIVVLIPKEGAAIRGSNTDETGAVTFKGLKPGEYKLFAWEDVEPNAYQDPEFVKTFEGRAEAIKLDPSARQAVQVKVISAEESAGKPGAQ
jgi:protocatechuate 3,4-dioxygenase beta subunit